MCVCVNRNINDHLGAFIPLQREELFCFNLSNGFKAAGLKGQRLFSLSHFFTTSWIDLRSFRRRKLWVFKCLKINHLTERTPPQHTVFHNQNQLSGKSILPLCTSCASLLCSYIHFILSWNTELFYHSLVDIDIFFPSLKFHNCNCVSQSVLWSRQKYLNTHWMAWHSWSIEGESLVIPWLFLHHHHKVDICGMECIVYTIGWLAIKFGSRTMHPQDEVK